MENQAVDVVGMIVRYLSVEDYLNCRQVSKGWRAKFDNETVWQALRNAHWPELPEVQGSWKKLGWSVINLMRGRFYSGKKADLQSVTYEGKEQSIEFAYPWLVKPSSFGFVYVLDASDMRAWKPKFKEQGLIKLGHVERGKEPVVISLGRMARYCLLVHRLSDKELLWKAERTGPHNYVVNGLQLYSEGADFDIEMAVTGFVGNIGVCGISWRQSTATYNRSISIYRLSDGELLDERKREGPIHQLLDGSIGHRVNNEWRTFTEVGWESVDDSLRPDVVTGSAKLLMRGLELTCYPKKLADYKYVDCTELRYQHRLLWQGNVCDQWSVGGSSFTPTLGFVLFKKYAYFNGFELLYTCPPDEEKVVPAVEMREEGKGRCEIQ